MAGLVPILPAAATAARHGGCLIVPRAHRTPPAPGPPGMRHPKPNRPIHALLFPSHNGVAH
jgi:hypothetical protein